MSRKTTVIVLSVATLWLVAGLLLLRNVSDDAYISFRYLDRLLAGQGLTFNSGERVEGYTNLLFILALVPLRAAGLPPEAAAGVVSVASLALLLWAVWTAARAIAHDAAAGPLAVVLAAGAVQLAHWTTAGLETIFAAALVATGNALLIARGSATFAVAAVYGLAILARPDHALPAGIALVSAFVPALKSRRAGRWLAAGALCAAFPLLQIAFRLAYYGAPLPNTYYAKLGVPLSLLAPGGWAYVRDWLASGGAVLLGAAALAPLCAGARSWAGLVLAAQIVAQLAYAVAIGGDHFPFHRFLVPVVPAAAVLGAAGLLALGRRLAPARPANVAGLLAVALASAAAALAFASPGRAAIENQRREGHERELLARWVASRLPRGGSIGINAAGLIPYRTGAPTIDMLGLNDAHIARTSFRRALQGGEAFVGHLKHDGEYVCRRRPDLVLTDGARLFPGRTADEAVYGASLATFQSDREFLSAPACRDLYVPVVEELEPGHFAVAFVRGAKPRGDEPAATPTTAAEWVALGLRRMRVADLRGALEAFERALAHAPGDPFTLTQIAYVRLDLDQPGEAAPRFQQVLSADPHAWDALYGLALAREKLGDDAGAVALWRRYAAEAPPSPWVNEARAHAQRLQR